MDRRLILLITASLGLVGCVREPIHTANDQRQSLQKADEEGAFTVKEISLTEAIERQPELAYCGQREYLGFNTTDYFEDSTIPKKEVKKYPQLKGAKSLYGSVRFGRNYNVPGSGTEYSFVLDSIGGEGYDRLYFDLNHDFDLSNDSPVELSKDAWPAGLWPHQTEKGRLFEELSVPMDFGPGYGVRSVKILPIAFINRDQSSMSTSVTVLFISLSFREGRIKIGDKDFDAVLAQPHAITGRFDQFVGLYLMAPDKKEEVESWWGADQLGAYRFVNGKYYTISTTPIGDKLFVKPYTGELGTFKCGPAQRNINNTIVQGSLRSQTSAVGIEKMDEVVHTMQPVTEWQVPVGDYTANYLSIHFDSLDIRVSDNYHSDGIQQDRTRQRKFAIQIRKDQPFVFDFSNKPEVLFASPAKDQVFKPGEQLSVKAVLIDPALDIMIRGLDGTREKPIEVVEVVNGKIETRKIYKSLDPMVTITDSAGKTVAEGPMPFG